jgi:hypothetical protein
MVTQVKMKELWVPTHGVTVQLFGKQEHLVMGTPMEDGTQIQYQLIGQNYIVFQFGLKELRQQVVELFILVLPAVPNVQMH